MSQHKYKTKGTNIEHNFFLGNSQSDFTLVKKKKQQQELTLGHADSLDFRLIYRYQIFFNVMKKKWTETTTKNAKCKILPHNGM